MSGVFVGFNPAPDCIRDDIDPLAAIVFGAVWRFSQMDRRQCDATLDTIAERSGLGTTATRARLRKLTARSWILAEERAGLPTVYRDAGRWGLRVVGEDSTPTLSVGPKRRPQREALPPPTLGVALPQREALAEDSFSKTEQSKTPARVETADAPAPVGAGTLSTSADLRSSTGTAPTAASTKAEAAAPTIARKPRAARPPDPLADVALDIMADTTGRRELPTRRYAALVWPLVRDIGRLTGEAPAPAAAVWWSFREYIDNREKDGWRFVKPHNARDEFGKWAANGGGPTIDAIRAMYRAGGAS